MRVGQAQLLQLAGDLVPQPSSFLQGVLKSEVQHAKVVKSALFHSQLIVDEWLNMLPVVEFHASAADSSWGLAGPSDAKTKPPAERCHQRVRHSWRLIAVAISSHGAHRDGREGSPRAPFTPVLRSGIGRLVGAVADRQTPAPAG